jgi:hypothetical protein
VRRFIKRFQWRGVVSGGALSRDGWGDLLRLESLAISIEADKGFEMVGEGEKIEGLYSR